MAEITLDCPQCTDGTLNFEITTESADDGIWYHGGFIADERDCQCKFSDAQITVLEGDASFEYAESLGYEG